MSDVWLAALFGFALLFLVIVVTSELAAEHTSAQIPKALLYGSTPRRGSRMALAAQLPWVVALLGGGEVVFMIILLHPQSTIPVRFIATAELVGSALWFLYLRRLITKGV
jgi:hypothetical protein